MRRADLGPSRGSTCRSLPRTARLRWGAATAWVGCLIALVALGAVAPVYWVYLLSTVAIGALVARGIGVVTNQSGLITMCQMSFAAIGGWVVSWLALEVPGLPFPVLLLCGGLAALPVGLLLGAATSRIRGVELAVATLGFAAALDLVLRQGAFPGVGSGTPVIPAGAFADPRWFFALCWAVFVVLQLELWLLGRTSLGLGWIAIRSSERAAAALGVRVVRAKASAFGASALLAGVAGGLLAGQYGLLTPDVFSPLTSLVYLVTAVLCGASLASGAVLAGVFAVFIPELLRRVGLPLDVGNALLALGAFDVLRRGTGGIAEQLRAKLHDRAFRDVRVTCALGEAAAAPVAEAARVCAPSASTPHALEVAGLTVSYGGNRVLDGVDLAVRAGEVHALIGSNGAGKTTLVDAVSGFLPAYGGQVRLGGDPLEGCTVQARAARGLRRTFQQGRAVDALTVDESLWIAAASVPGSRAARRQRVRAVHAYFALPDGTVPVRLMDAGSRRVLEIAATLVAEPRVLLLDEPAAGLADAESHALAERVRRIPEAFGCSVLVIEHDMTFVRAAADRVTVLDDGRVLAYGAVDAVLHDARVIAAYLGEEVAP